MDTLLFAVVLGCGAAVGHLYGVHQATAAAQVAEKARTAAALKAKGAEDALVLAAEQRQHAADKATFDKFKKEDTDAHHENDRLIADLRSDNRRLRVPVQHQACAPAPAAGGPAAGGTGEEGRAELTADAGVFVVGLLKRGDDAIRKHAAVVDLYENLRAACTAPIPDEVRP